MRISSYLKRGSILLGYAGFIFLLFNGCGPIGSLHITREGAEKACKQWLEKFRKSDEYLWNASDCRKYSERPSSGRYSNTVKGYKIEIRHKYTGEKPWDGYPERINFNWLSWED